MLETYDSLLRDTASKRGHAYVDLADLIPGGQSGNSTPPAGLDRLTDNGLHFSPYGDWRAGPQLALKVGAPQAAWKLDLDAPNRTDAKLGTKLVSAKLGETVEFELLDDRLPPPAAPRHSPEGSSQFVPRLLTIAGLPAGDYELSIDGKPQGKFSSKQLSAGVTLTSGPEFDQAEKLRQTINAKNELFFHRYRPQNETYLFLFRKHEQGNNAVEIPQFDPLIAEKEKEIAELAKPKPHQYKLTKVK
jgi:hypothetical protein